MLTKIFFVGSFLLFALALSAQTFIVPETELSPDATPDVRVLLSVPDGAGVPGNGHYTDFSFADKVNEVVINGDGDSNNERLSSITNNNGVLEFTEGTGDDATTQNFNLTALLSNTPNNQASIDAGGGIYVAPTVVAPDNLYHEFVATSATATHNTPISFPTETANYVVQRNGREISALRDFTRTGDLYQFVIPLQADEVVIWRSFASQVQ